MGETIDKLSLEMDNVILKYERISFLWNNAIYEVGLDRFFRQHIKFIKYLIKTRNREINLTLLHKKFPLLGEIKNIKGLMLDLNDFFNKKFLLNK